MNLHPPIETIEEDLLSPSDRLIERWIANDPTLPAETRRALEGSSMARSKRQIFEDAIIASRVVLPATIKVGEATTPPPLLEMIERRSATREKFPGVEATSPGQLRLVQGGEDMNRPLAILLWKETEEAPGVWAGWMASREVDYASFWDVLLEDGDQPCDPLVAMIQLWNPVQVCTGSVGRVLGKLSEERLATMATTFADFLSGERPDASHSRPGTLVDRLTTTGERLMTGTPVGEEEDPRRRYQDLYFAAAGMVKDVARLAVEASAE